LKKIEKATKKSKKMKFSLDVPIKDMPEKALNLVLYGTENDQAETSVDFDETATNGQIYATEYEGIVNMLKRWFAGGTSDSLREWVEKFMELKTCPTCEGARLKKESLWFLIDRKNISELSEMNLDKLYAWFDGIELRLSNKQRAIAKDVVKEIRERLTFLLNVGLTYLTLNRPSKTLSGGESQRIRLATQIGSQLQGITYILDEPSIGLHQRDNHRLIEALKNLRDIGNSVLVVEHDKDIMLAADHLIDIGPRAGFHGGKIVAEGKPSQMLTLQTLTSSYLNGIHHIAIPKERRKGNGKFLQLKGCKGNNLKNVDVSFPLGKFIVVTGVSGSGKSTLINETLYPILSKHAFNSKAVPLEYKTISGLESIDKVIEIDQSPIGRTPRSNPATYTGLFTFIRDLFAWMPEAKARGFKPGRFSFNVKGGRCEACQGDGVIAIEMHFLPNVYVTCEQCKGRRYNRETLEIKYRGKSIADILELTVDQALPLLENVPAISNKLKTLQSVGLGYVALGQSATTLSGGEAQRVKLAKELSKRGTGRTLYILDEPTTGLHFEDTRKLLDVLMKLVDQGNTIVVIEHNLDVIKSADYVIDLGPEGGAGGGRIVAAGTPEEVARQAQSATGRFLGDIMTPPERETRPAAG
jgi:excinuclease ABC subunit A